MPYFLREENDDQVAIKNMPGIKRFSTNELIKELKIIQDLRN